MSFKHTLFLVILFSSLICEADLPKDVKEVPSIKDQQADIKVPDNNTPIISNLEFEKVWARPSVSTNNNSAIYMVINNNSNNDYTLVNASSDVANKVEIHQTITDEKGVTKMVKLDNLIIPAHSKADLKPGSTHIMLLKLKRTLKIGDKFTLSLYFTNNYQENVNVEVLEN